MFRTLKKWSFRYLHVTWINAPAAPLWEESSLYWFGISNAAIMTRRDTALGIIVQFFVLSVFIDTLIYDN